MTWLRFDTNAPTSDVVGHLADAVDVPLPLAFGCYAATILGFGAHRPDGHADQISDRTLEQWAMWTGPAGAWATAFRARCVDGDGVVRGWWRQEKLIARQREKASRVGKQARDTQGFPDEPEFPAQKSAGNSPAKKSAGNETIRNDTNKEEQLARQTENQPPQPSAEVVVTDPPHPPVSVPYLVRCVVALNAGLAANRNLGGQYREVSAAEQAGTVDWEAFGVPVDLACQVVQRVATHYRPKGHNRQPSSLRYFDAAVKEAFTGDTRLRQDSGPQYHRKFKDPYANRPRGKAALGDVLGRVMGSITAPTQGAA